MFLARVTGRVPNAVGIFRFQGLELIEAAKREPTAVELEKMKHLPIQVGIDVAGPGEDETVLVARAGGAILESHFWSDPDPRGRVARCSVDCASNRAPPSRAG